MTWVYWWIGLGAWLTLVALGNAHAAPTGLSQQPNDYGEDD